MSTAETQTTFRNGSLEAIERAVIQERYEQMSRQLTATADSLGISRAALRYKLQRWGLLPYNGERKSPLCGK